VDEDGAAVLDVVLELEGTSLPAEHAFELWRAVEACLPWLASEPGAGIHPLRTSPSSGGEALLARRAKLVLRVPRARGADTLGLCGRTLQVAGRKVGVGAGVLRPLRAWTTLHAQRVTFGPADDATFQDDIARSLAALDVECEFITGRRRSQRAEGREIAGYSVALVGVGAAQSLRVQAVGMGGERGLGWGIFVPHKAIAATE
jgi:CRISPR-associated protein Cas6